ncbi:MAG: zinc-ribbon domain-containing protein [Faecousia sp.]
MECDKMFCEKCGKELKQNVRFCNYCGASLESTQAAPVQPTKNKKSKKILMLCAASIVVIAAVLTGVVVGIRNGGSAVGLKYDWGTIDDVIIENETILSDEEEEIFRDLRCENPDGKVGSIEEISSGEIEYTFVNRRLGAVVFYLDDAYTSDELLEQMEKTFGTKHYALDLIEFGAVVWWIDDTIIKLDPWDDAIVFFDEDYYPKYYDASYVYQDMVEFFGK